MLFNIASVYFKVRRLEIVNIDYNELADWKAFESLVEAYFEKVLLDRSNSVSGVRTESSGEGIDGGMDILLTFQFKDSIVEFERKWVVQCKFYDKTLGMSHIAGINIPTLVHEHGAVGYLLVCKSGVSSSVKAKFDNLNRNCKFGYEYICWDGTGFRQKIGTE